MEDQMTEKKTSPIKAIRAKCLDCCCFQYNEVKLCTATGCPLYAFRLGKNPYRKEMSEEQKAKTSERMKNMQAKKKKEQNEI